MTEEQPRLHAVGEQISDAQAQAWAKYWAQWIYVRPHADALAEAFGVPFAIDNTGGGCICIVNHAADLEGGYLVYVGSGVDGPLWTEAKRHDYYDRHGHYDGFGVGIIDRAGYTVADARDQQAHTPEELVALVKKALELVPLHDETTAASWRRAADGTITEKRCPR